MREEKKYVGAMRQVGSTFRSLAKAFDSISEVVQDAASKVGESVWEVASREYLQHHKRLPGSTRNARMLKKRRKKVFDWFFAHIRSEHSLRNRGKLDLPVVDKLDLHANGQD